MSSVAFLYCLLLSNTDPSVADLGYKSPVLAVMPLSAKNISRDVVEILDELLLKRVSDRGLYKVIGTADINRLLKYEKQKDLLACDDTACLADIGGLLGAEYLLTGTVGKLGDKVIVSLVFFETRRATIKRSQESNRNREDLFEETLDLALSKILGAGSVAISTTPPGATVAVDGRPVGLSPQTLGDLPSGRHEIQLALRNHEPEAITVIVLPNAMRAIDVTLKPFVGVVRIQSQPPKASCVLDGKIVGETPCAIARVSVGEHALGIQHPHYVQALRTVDVVRGETVTWSETLEALPVPVAVSTTPTGATVAVDGDHKGVTDLKMQLLPGRYQLEVELPGHVNQARTIAITPGEPFATAFQLVPGLSAAERRWRGVETASRWTLTVVAAVSLTVWGWQGLRSRALHDDAGEFPVTSAEFKSRKHDSRHAARVADVALASAVVSAAGGTFLWLRGEF